MPQNNQSQSEPSVETSFVSRIISVGKDLVALLRDSTIFILTVLLIVFPSKFNSILVAAGFEEGSFVGLKWKSNLEVTNEQLDQASEQITVLQSKNDELLKALDVAKQQLEQANGNSDSGELKFKIAELEKQNIQLKSDTQKIQSSVSKRVKSNLDFMQTAKITDSKSNFLVGLQTVGIGDEVRVDLNEKLQNDGYSLDEVTYSYPEGQKPSWFAYRPTVFFYSASARSQANSLAKFMKEQTGVAFHVQRGAGLGVDADKKNVTLFVHYIR